MCLICVEWNAGRLTNKDAFRNLGESLRAATDQDEYDQVDHLLELSNKIMDKEVPFEETDSEVDSLWDGQTRSDD